MDEEEASSNVKDQTIEIENALMEIYGEEGDESNDGGEFIEVLYDGDSYSQDNNDVDQYVEEINEVEEVVVDIEDGIQAVDIDSDELKQDGNQAGDTVSDGLKKDCRQGIEISNSEDLFAEKTHFMVNSVEELKVVLEDYYEKTESRFVGHRKTKYFGSPLSECSLLGHNLQWCDTNKDFDNLVPFNGIPYMIIGHYDLDCQFGYDRNVSKKAKRKLLKEAGLLTTESRQSQPRKRCGCPAKISIKQIIRFPEFKIEMNNKSGKKKVSGKLKAKLEKCRDEVQMEVCIVGKLPAVSEHNYHALSLNARQSVLQDLIVLGQELYLKGTPYRQIQQLLHKHVVEDMFWNKEPPDQSHRKFYPTLKDIRYFCTRSLQLLQFTDDEQECIKKVISEVESQGNVNTTFSIKNEVSKSDENNTPVEETKKKKKDEDKYQTFTFCSQSDSQRRLLKRYNNVAYLVEVERKTPLKSALTFRMYLIVVQTNIDHQVVGCMIISKQQKDGLIDALRLFRKWNPRWEPSFFMVECCLPVICDALTMVFPECHCFLSPQCCEKNWREYLTKPSNNLFEHTDEILSFLKFMQHSATEDSLSIAAASLQASEIWQSRDNLREWFQNNWLPHAKHWVVGYRPAEFLVLKHLTSTVDDCIGMYKEALERSTKFNGFINMLKVVSGNIPAVQYEKYVNRNKKAYVFYKHYKKTTKLPGYLTGMPTSLLPYIKGLCKMAESTNLTISRDNFDLFTVKYTQTDVQEEHGSEVKKHQETNGVDEEICFEVHKEVSKTEFGSVEYSNTVLPGDHTISFGDSDSHPYCTCSHWLRYRLPCVHMLSVFYTIPGWKYDMLSPLYRASPLLRIDSSAIKFPLDDATLSSFSDKECQTETSFSFSVPVATQTTDDGDLTFEDNMFEIPSKIKDHSSVITQAKDFAKNLEKLSFLFKYKWIYFKFRHQVEKMIYKLEEVSLKNKTGEGETIISNTVMPRKTSNEHNIWGGQSLNLKINKTISKQKKSNKIVNNGVGVTVTGIHKPANKCTLTKHNYVATTTQKKDIATVYSNRCEKINLDKSCNGLSTQTYSLADANYKLDIDKRKRKSSCGPGNILHLTDTSSSENKKKLLSVLKHVSHLNKVAYPTKTLTPKQVESVEKPGRISKTDIARCLPLDIEFVPNSQNVSISIDGRRDTSKNEGDDLDKSTDAKCISTQLQDLEVADDLICHEGKYEEAKPD